jgi:hypothetical protein
MAWAAGWFEGEGSILLSGGRIHARVPNTDHEIIVRFAETLELGTVYGPYPTYTSGRRKKPLWVWLATEEAALDAVALMWPWLGRRRRSRAQELTGVRFPVFSRVSTELLAERFGIRPQLPAAAT